MRFKDQRQHKYSAVSDIKYTTVQDKWGNVAVTATCGDTSVSSIVPENRVEGEKDKLTRLLVNMIAKNNRSQR